MNDTIVTPLDESVIVVTLDNGKTIRLKPLQAKDKKDGTPGNVFHCTQSIKDGNVPYYSKWGVNASTKAVGEELPSSITIAGVTIEAEETITKASGNPKVEFKAKLVFDDLDEDGNEIEVERKLFLGISKTGKGTYNVCGSLTRVGGGSASGSGRPVVDEL